MNNKRDEAKLLQQPPDEAPNEDSTTKFACSAQLPPEPAEKIVTPPMTISSRCVSPSTSSTTKQVRFSTVQIREFERIVTQNPACSSGVPIGIGWNCTPATTLSVDELETRRSKTRRLRNKKPEELVLPRDERERLLRDEWGYTRRELAEAVRAHVRAQHLRRQSVNAIGRYDRWEEWMESLQRKLHQTLRLSSKNTPCGPSSKNESDAVTSAPLTLESSSLSFSTPSNSSNRNIQQNKRRVWYYNSSSRSILVSH
ncbi:hypothetical protein ACA910_002195 [Epithemia clementina (nom. ined.)]